MGSSVKDHLRPRCGVFHQIPTLAVATGSRPWRESGTVRSVLLLFVSVLPAPVYFRCAAAASCGNVFACRALI